MGLRLLDEALVEWDARLVLIIVLTASRDGLTRDWVFFHLDFGLSTARFGGLRICSRFF